jgi:hypothetical protein
LHIKTESVSAASGVIFNNVFSSTFNNYRILVNNLTGTNKTTLNLRLRVAGTDASAADYNRQLTVFRATTSSPSRTTGMTGMDAISRVATSTPVIGDIFLVNPFEATPTSAQMQDNEGEVGTSICLFMATFNHTLSTSYDGFSMLASAGTITGSISVYGYKK